MKMEEKEITFQYYGVRYMRSVEKIYPNKSFTVGSSVVNFNGGGMLFLDNDKWNSEVMHNLVNGKINHVELELWGGAK